MSQSNTRRSTSEWAAQEIAGSFASADEAAKRLRMAASHCHLIGGATLAPLVVGHEIVISVIPIHRARCYPANPGARKLDQGKQATPEDGTPKWGIGKSDLMNLANAAGVEWTKLERLDDGSHPFFVWIRAHGRYRQIDGTWRPIFDDRDSDFQDGSAQLNGKTENEIKQLRSNILRSTITKARLRAVRGAFGLDHGMDAEDLEKPFVFSRMVFTGRDADPEIRRLFAATIAQAQLAATAALYGPPPSGLLGPGAPLMAALPQRAAARPAFSTDGHGIVDCDEEGMAVERPSSPTGTAGAPPPAAPPQSPPPPPQPQTPPAAAAGNGGAVKPPRGGWVIPGGKSRGTTLAQASDNDLTYWAERISSDLASGNCKPDFRARDEALVKAMRDELARRDEQDANRDVPANAGDAYEGGPT